MSSFQIFCDGACDIKRDLAAQNNINIIPFYVSLDHKSYFKEIDELSLDTFYKNMIEEGGFPKTSLPSVQDYINAFTPYLEQGIDIICFTITHTLSGSLQSAVTAAHILQEKYPRANIYAVDSWHATGSQQLLVLEAARMQRDGKTIHEVLHYIEKAKIDARIFFMIHSLSHLEAGGRIGKLASLSSSILKIKPLIVLSDGEISIAGVVRSRKKGIQKLAELIQEHFHKTGENPDEYRFLLGVTNTFQEIEDMRAALSQVLPSVGAPPYIQIGATIASHTGPGTAGFCFVKRYEAYC